jgi:hypothetical protein
VVARAGAVVAPGLGATAVVDARIVKGFYLGAEGGFFTDETAGYPFGGARASYRIEATTALRIVPSVGLAHVQVLKMDIDETGIGKQAPVSATAGLELALELGQFVVGADLQVMPTHVTVTRSYPPPVPSYEKTLWLMPASVFAGMTF